MLGLGGSITNNTKPPVFDFRKIRGLIGWWDFSVKHQSQLKQQDGSPVTNDTKIWTVKNLAFSLEKNNTRKEKALGKFLTSAGAGNRPTWFSADGGYAQFTSSESDRMFVGATSSGAVDTNQLSSSSISQDGYTLFIVCKNDSSSLSSGEYIFAMFGEVEQANQLVLASSTVHGWKLDGMEPPKSETNVNTGESVDNSKILLTLHKNSTDSNEMYLNGRKNVGTTSGASGDHVMDMSQNSGDTHVFLGGTGNNFTWNGRIYETVIFNRALNAREVKKIEMFLLKKHNI